jgi:3-dehydroquinate dehydratase/shikimate dehydrogenase
MGEAGVPSRLLALSWGSAAVFAAPPGDGAPAAASGQIPADLMARLYRVREIGEATRLLGITGNPVLHSLSPALHNPRLHSAGQDARYLPLPAADFNDFLGFAHAVNLAAASVTTPFKNAAFSHAEHTTAEADAAGAVNTLLFNEGRPAWGGNTDGEGVLAPLAPWLHFPKMARVLIAGYGPAARAAGAAVGQLCPAVFFTGRKKTEHALPGEWIDAEAAALERFSILINATPVAAPRWEAPLSALMKSPPPVILEMDYRDPASPAAYPPGVQVIGGRDMLRAQGEAQARLFIAHLAGAAVA